jgi:hypothetical protein
MEQAGYQDCCCKVRTSKHTAPRLPHAVAPLFCGDPFSARGLFDSGGEFVVESKAQQRKHAKAGDVPVPQAATAPRVACRSAAPAVRKL